MREENDITGAEMGISSQIGRSKKKQEARFEFAHV